jgi:hypothetical protein
LGQEGWPTVTEHERLNYLNDHISYEVIMLNYTFMRLMTFKASTADDELERNAFLEAFGVHAWNLVEFLSKKVRKNDRNASDYIPSFEPPDGKPIEQALLRLQKQILRITTLRKTDPGGKFNITNARELYAWIVPAILKFRGALSARYRKELNSRGQIETLLANPVDPYGGNQDDVC